MQRMYFKAYLEYCIRIVSSMLSAMKFIVYLLMGYLMLGGSLIIWSISQTVY